MSSASRTSRRASPPATSRTSGRAAKAPNGFIAPLQYPARGSRAIAQGLKHGVDASADLAGSGIRQIAGIVGQLGDAVVDGVAGSLGEGWDGEAETGAAHAPRRALPRALVACSVYAKGRLVADVDLADAAEASSSAGGFAWVELRDPDPAAVEAACGEFGIHPLAVEDAVLTHARPRLEQFGVQLMVIVKPVRYVDSQAVVESSEITLITGPGFALCIQQGEGEELREVQAALQANPEMLALGPQSVVYAVIDRVIDGYQPALEALEDDIDEAESLVFTAKRTSPPTERIYNLKREVLEFRRAVTPLGDALERLSAPEPALLAAPLLPYLGNASDHLARVVEQIESYDGLLSDALNANSAQVSLRQNEDMRKISAWVAIAAVSTLIAGIYGMNFENMPELRSRYGYYVVLGVMGFLSYVLYRGFRRNGWL